MSVQVESLELNIKTNASEAASGLAKLASSMEKLKSAANISGLENVAQSLSEINKALENTQGVKNLSTLSNALKKLESVKIPETIVESINAFTEALDTDAMGHIEADGLAKLANALGRLSGIKISPDIAGQIINIGYAADQITESTAQRIRDLADAFRALKSKQLSTKIQTPTVMEAKEPELIETTQSETALFNLQNAAYTVREALSNIGAGAASFGSAIASGANKAYSALSSLGEYMKGKFNSALKDATSGFTKLASTFKRIAIYRLFRAVISQITQAMKEGINNVYYYSQLIGGTFASSMDSLASSALYLKNSLGAMVSPLISALAPAINYVIDLFVELLNTINMVFARLSGSSTYTKAVRNATAYGDALDGVGSSAAGAAKEIKDATTGIDELNIIEQPTSSGGGGGSGGGTDYGSMFEEVEINSDIIDFVDRLKDAFNAGDWETLGTLLGDKFNEIVDSIDWAGLGEKTGYYLNGAIQTAYYFLKEADFVNLGSKVATFLNNALEQIDSEYIGRLLVRKVTAGLDFLGGLLGTLDWGLVTSKISSGIIGALKEATEWIQDKDWYEIGQTLVNKLADAFNGVNWGGLSSNFFAFLGTSIASAVMLMKGVMEAVADKVVGYFDDYITNDDGTRKTGIDLVEGICQGILDAIAGIGDWIAENVVVPFMDALMAGFGIEADYSSKTEEIGEAITEGLTGGLNPKRKLDELYEQFVQPVIGGIETGFDIISGKSVTTEEIGEAVGDSFLGGIATSLLTNAAADSGVLDYPATFKENVGVDSGVYEDCGTEVSEQFNKGVESGLSDTTTVLAGFAENAADSFSSIATDKFATAGGTVISSFNSKISSESKTSEAPIKAWATDVNTTFTADVNKDNYGTYAADAVQGFKDIINSDYPETEEAIKSWTEDTIKWFTDDVNSDNFGSYGEEITTGFSTSVSDTYSSAQEPVTSWATDTVNWFKDIASGDSFYQIASDVIDGFNRGITELYYKTEKVMRKWAQDLSDTFAEELDVGSPSKLFYSIGGYVVEGFNDAVEEIGKSTAGIMDDWVASFANVEPQLAYAVSYTGATPSVSRDDDDIKSFYLEYIEPLLSEIAADTKRQADKEEKTVLNVNGRQLASTVTQQNKVNGYSFRS